MIVIAQCHIHRRNVTQTAQKLEQMREPFWYIEQVACDHDPVRLEIADDLDDAIMAGVISVEMQIGEMDGTAAGEQPMQMGMASHFIVGEAEFPVWGTAKQLIQGMAQGMADGGAQKIGP